MLFLPIRPAALGTEGGVAAVPGVRTCRRRVPGGSGAPRPCGWGAASRPGGRRGHRSCVADKLVCVQPHRPQPGGGLRSAPGRAGRGLPGPRGPRSSASFCRRSPTRSTFPWSSFQWRDPGGQGRLPWEQTRHTQPLRRAELVTRWGDRQPGGGAAWGFSGGSAERVFPALPPRADQSPRAGRERSAPRPPAPRPGTCLWARGHAPCRPLPPPAPTAASSPACGRPLRRPEAAGPSQCPTVPAAPPHPHPRLRWSVRPIRPRRPRAAQPSPSAPALPRPPRRPCRAPPLLCPSNASLSSCRSAPAAASPRAPCLPSPLSAPLPSPSPLWLAAALCPRPPSPVRW